MRHPNKVAWLIHQYRAAYELCGTEYSDFAHTKLDVGLRDTLIRLDTEMLGECRRHVRQRAQHRAARLAKFNGLAAEALYHPPRLAARLRPGPYGDYVLSVGRHRIGQAGGSAGARRWRTSIARLRLVSPATARSGRTSSALAEDARRRRPRRPFSAPSTTTS